MIAHILLGLFCLGVASYFARRILVKPDESVEEPESIISSWNWPKEATVGERPYDFAYRRDVPMIS